MKEDCPNLAGGSLQQPPCLFWFQIRTFLIVGETDTVFGFMDFPLEFVLVYKGLHIVRVVSSVV